MPVKIFAILFISLLSFSIQAQEKQSKAKRPDLPGSFIIEFGFNRGVGTKPTKFDQGFWGSRTLNLYYQYPIRIKNTKFSYNPGLGFSFERYSLTNNYTLTRRPEADGTFALRPATEFDIPNAQSSMIVMNYIDFMPAEVEFFTNPEDKARSFHISGGARIGVLFESHTKVDYTEGGENKTFKDKQNHGLANFRYGVYSRIGVGFFSLYGYYNLSPVFEPNKGPEQTQFSTLTFGISLSGF
jgi:hypothetical protein